MFAAHQHDLKCWLVLTAVPDQCNAVLGQMLTLIGYLKVRQQVT